MILSQVRGHCQCVVEKTKVQVNRFAQSGQLRTCLVKLRSRAVPGPPFTLLSQESVPLACKVGSPLGLHSKAAWPQPHVAWLPHCSPKLVQSENSECFSDVNFDLSHGFSLCVLFLRFLDLPVSFISPEPETARGGFLVTSGLAS